MGLHLAWKSKNLSASIHSYEMIYSNSYSIKKNGIDFMSINYFTVIYEYLTALKKNDEMSIYINLRNSLFDIIIYK